MKRLKRFILSLLLTKKERVMIWNALWFSNHTYRRRGNVDGAAAVQVVMNRTESMIVPKGKTYSEKEVSNIIDEILKGTQKATEQAMSDIAHEEFRKGYQKGKNERTVEAIVAPLRKFGKPINVEEENGQLKVDMELNEGMEIDREKCEKCEGCEGCIIYAMIFGHDKEEDADSNDSNTSEVEDTEKEEKDENQASESTELHQETVKEDEVK